MRRLVEIRKDYYVEPAPSSRGKKLIGAGVGTMAAGGVVLANSRKIPGQAQRTLDNNTARYLEDVKANSESVARVTRAQAKSKTLFGRVRNARELRAANRELKATSIRANQSASFTNASRRFAQSAAARKKSAGRLGVGLLAGGAALSALGVRSRMQGRQM